MDKKCCFLTCFVNLSRVDLPVARGHFTCAECTKKPFFNAKNRFLAFFGRCVELS